MTTAAITEMDRQTTTEYYSTDPGAYTESAVTSTGDLEVVTSDGDAVTDGDLTSDGDVVTDGDLTSDGDVVTDGDVTSDGDAVTSTDGPTIDVMGATEATTTEATTSEMITTEATTTEATTTAAVTFPTVL